MALDELPSEARAILSACATTDDPSADDRARIGAKFERTLGACGIVIPLAQTASVSQAAAAATSVALRTSRSLLAPKLLWPLFGAGLLAAGLAYELRREPDKPDPATRPPPQWLASATPKALTPAPTASAESPTAAAEASPTPPTPTLLAPVVAPKSARPNALQTNPGSRTIPASPARSGSDDSLDSEVGLLRSATEAVRLGRYDRALRLLELHASRFPDGTLREERAGLRVLTLCGLGKTGLGLEERERFLRASPRSVLAERVRGACSTPEHGTPRVAHP